MQLETLALDFLLTLARVGRWLTSNPDEAAGAVLGLVGAYLVADTGGRARWGWLAFLASNAALLSFAWRYSHPGMFALQVGFTLTSVRGILLTFQRRYYWHEWRGDFAGNASMLIMHLVRRPSGWHLDLHKMVAPDMAGCFHTHPAKALRIVLWGGYVEELEDCTRVHWWPGRIGIVRPELSHRIASLPRGRSYSLWLRWPKTHETQLRGPGWSAAEAMQGAVSHADRFVEIEVKGIV